MEFTLLFAALTGAAAAWLGLRIWPDRLPERAFDQLIGASVTGLAVGRLAAMVDQGINPLTNPGELLIVRGGVATPIAALSFILFLGWTNRRQLSNLDALSPSILLGLAGWQAGCLWRGACLGTASDLPWAVAQPGSDITRHPVEIYAALLLVVGAILVSRLGWRPWLRSGAALTVASLARLATEPMRPSLDGGPVGWYLAGLLAGIGLIALGLLRHRQSATPT